MAIGDNVLDLTIKQGKSFAQVLQWEQPKLIYRPITAATVADPCVLTVPTHGMPNNWHFRIINAKGMTQLNPDADTGRFANGLDDYTATVIDPNTIELNDVAASALKAYAGGGSIIYRLPYDLAGFTARMKVKDDPASLTTILDLTNVNGGIVLDNTLKTITIVVTEVQAIALVPGSYYFDLELVSAGGAVTELVHGTVTVPYAEITK
jgi:hypothetical protein